METRQTDSHRYLSWYFADTSSSLFCRNNVARAGGTVKHATGAGTAEIQQPIRCLLGHWLTARAKASNEYAPPSPPGQSHTHGPRRDSCEVVQYIRATHQNVAQQAGESDAGERVGRESQPKGQGDEPRVHGVAAQRVHPRGVEDGALRWDRPRREVPAELQGACGGIHTRCMAVRCRAALEVHGWKGGTRRGGMYGGECRWLSGRVLLKQELCGQAVFTRWGLAGRTHGRERSGRRGGGCQTQMKGIPGKHAHKNCLLSSSDGIRWRNDLRGV